MQEFSLAFDLVPVLKLIITVFVLLKLLEFLFPSFFKARSILSDGPEESRSAKPYDS